MGSLVRALVVAATSLLLVPAAVGAAASPRQSLDAILAAGRAQRSVHYVALATNGVSHTRLVCDVATDLRDPADHLFESAAGRER